MFVQSSDSLDLSGIHPLRLRFVLTAFLTILFSLAPGTERAAVGWDSHGIWSSPVIPSFVGDSIHGASGMGIWVYNIPSGLISHMAGWKIPELNGG